MVFPSSSRSNRTVPLALTVVLTVLLLAGCATTKREPTALPAPAPEARRGDEIIVAGQLFHTGTRVITWRDPGGYDAYHGSKDNYAERRPSRDARTPATPLDLAQLRGLVDQFVIHYDSEGFSRHCFDILQKRGLSVHFLLDLDGTIYQTLDLRERAYHATIANSRSIGIEIANIGAFPPAQAAELSAWYHRDAAGNLYITPPAKLGPTEFHTPGYVGRPARPFLVTGKINRHLVEQYDFTPAQYVALIKLTAALHRIFPRIALDCPRDANGRILRGELTAGEYARFHGVLGHWHIQSNKVDPGPAFQWDLVLDGARRIDQPGPR